MFVSIHYGPKLGNMDLDFTSPFTHCRYMWEVSLNSDPCGII